MERNNQHWTNEKPQAVKPFGTRKVHESNISETEDLTTVAVMTGNHYFTEDFREQLSHRSQRHPSVISEH